MVSISCASQAEELFSTFKRVAGPIGMRLERPIRLEVWDDIGDQLTSEPKMQFVVSIMVSNSDDLYGAMKKLCCAKSPIVSQVINIRIISQRALTKRYST